MITTAGTEIWTGLAALGVFIAVIAAVVVVVWLIARSHGTTASLSVRATGTFAGIWLGLSAIGVVISIARLATGADVDVADTGVDWEPYCGSGNVLCAGPERLAAGVSFGPRLLVELGTLSTTLAIAAPALALFLLCRSALRNSVFPERIPRLFLICGAVALLLGSAGPILGVMGAGLAAAEVLPADADVFYSFTVPWWPALVALACAAFAAIFRHGSRLQSDTEGLV
ncbi:hypothetical protein [Microbacterium sorbitolivorans]|uniref:DUF2975 domain-containing protein n=1 Tax=Microbacterium sorbitolivorans TaxID=1867410 RepID=A0A367XZE3_9MICO|nr:hypothetical protein [Microbacterium sorbitolivorans]RCK58640.1 hypothetical protein DTO57_10830 [Microbacterium sorbitolivorans]